MSIQTTMEDKLNKAFSPDRLVIINESHLHAGHHHPAPTITAPMTAPARRIFASAWSLPPLPA